MIGMGGEPERGRRGFEVLLAGCGAIGSRFAAGLDSGAALTCADRQRVAPENVGVGVYDQGDIGAGKAAVVAARHRARGGVARALDGDLRYTLRPGLASALGGAVVCVDNPTALRDVAEMLWASGRHDLPVLVLTCAGQGKVGWQVRGFVTHGLCPVCLWGDEDRRADRLGLGMSCADTSAPRASAEAAAGAARAAAAILERWRTGEHAIANCRWQYVGSGAESGSERASVADPVPFLIRMPSEVSPRCPVQHHAADTRTGTRDPIEDLGDTIAGVTVGSLAARALAFAGDDAEILLGRRAVPLGGLYCQRCSALAPAPLALLSAPEARRSVCGCGEMPLPLGTRNIVGARELGASEVAAWSLAAWGAGHGDEFMTAGRHGRVRLRCRFDWRELDAH